MDSSPLPLFLVWISPPLVLSWGCAVIVRTRWGIVITPALLTAGLLALLVLIWRDVDCYYCANDAYWTERVETQGDWAWLSTIVTGVAYAGALVASLFGWLLGRLLRSPANDAPLR